MGWGLLWHELHGYGLWTSGVIEDEKFRSAGAMQRVLLLMSDDRGRDQPQWPGTVITG